MPVSKKQRMDSDAGGLGIKWDLSAVEIEAATAALIAEYEEVLKQVAGVSSDQASFETILAPWAAADGVAATKAAECTFPAYCCGSGTTPEAKAVRAASSTSKKALKQFWDGIYERPELFRQVQLLEASQPALPPQQARLVAVSIDRFERSGAALAGADRDEFSALRKRSGEICSSIEQNITEDTTRVGFTKDELQGVDERFLDGLPIDEASGLLMVGLKMPESDPVMSRATNPATRKRLCIAQHTKCPENKELFAELIHNRRRCAQLLGFTDHAAYMLAGKMAGTTDAVETFIDGIAAKLRPQAEVEFGALRAVKQADTGDAADNAFYRWDSRFYDRIQKETALSIDESKVAEFFPMDHVLAEIMAIYSEVLGLTFTRVEAGSDHSGDAPTWHPDAQLYSCSDTATADLLGHFYLDLFPRPGKYGHQCVLPIRPSFVRADGTRQTPAVCLVGNNPSPSADGRPSLLRHGEVKTLFHEFGHVCHGVCTKADYPLFSWAWSAVPYPGGVEYDFLEAPSMMMELWTWEKAVIKRLSSKYDAPAERLPDDVIDALTAMRDHNRALNMLRYFSMAKSDVGFHKARDFGLGQAGFQKITDMFYDTMSTTGLVEPVPGGHYITSWYHPVQGYDVGYYGYGWSEAFSHDMFKLFKEAPGGCFDTHQGRRYRDLILTPGATQSGTVMLEAFLGRPPSDGPFLASLGIK